MAYCILKYLTLVQVPIATGVTGAGLDRPTSTVTNLESGHEETTEIAMIVAESLRRQPTSTAMYLARTQAPLRCCKILSWTRLSSHTKSDSRTTASGGG